ncbi:MAG: bifunctional diguanylate cyclase/phosphodiesterase [Cellvibrionaceae bacterium]|nr:bifunctional diguanylate cyclase/phosphodiesterase [Cellvibrionaceae bacterium]MCV6626076.1 bifunctional diguanylate cyclase/phosphodiesterase [Cellvibrionaceae bacterium]
MPEQVLSLSTAVATGVLVLLFFFTRLHHTAAGRLLTAASLGLFAYFILTGWSPYGPPRDLAPAVWAPLLNLALGLLCAGLWQYRRDNYGAALAGSAGVVAATSLWLAPHWQLPIQTTWLLLAAMSLLDQPQARKLWHWLCAGALAGTSLGLAISHNYAAIGFYLSALTLGGVVVADIYQKLYVQANSDPLSQLPNRRCLNQEAQRLSESKQGYWLALFTVDGIKQINDTYGFSAGDQAIWIASRRMLEQVGPKDFLGRNFAKEFAIISTRGEHELIDLINNINSAIKDIQSVDKHNVSMAIHCGISYNDDGEWEFPECLKKSSAALQFSEAKKETFAFIDDEILASVNRRSNLEKALRTAIAEKSLQVHFQPKYNCQQPEVIVGAEALARWQYQGKPVSPFEFIKLAEECNLITDLDRVIMEKAWVLGKQLQEKGLATKIAANFSPTSLSHGVSLFEMVKEIIEENGLDPELMEIEITESYLAHGEDIKQQLQSLRDLGLTIAMDDFGTGFSNLGQLEDLPLDTLKIDKIFIDKVMENPTVTEFIVDLAQKLQLQLVAEGVEDLEQLQWLSEHACQTIQGYLLSRPLPKEEFVALLESKRQRHEEEATPMPIAQSASTV